MEKIFARKKDLIIRDPVYRSANKLLAKIVAARCENGENILAPHATYDPIFDEIGRYYATSFCPDKIRDQHEKEHPDYWELFRLTGEIGSKWRVHVEINFAEKEISVAPYTHDEAIWVGCPPFDKYATHNASVHYPQLKWTPYPNPFNKPPILADINEFTTPGYKCPGNWIPILINASRLNYQDAKEIKKRIWEFVEKRLTKGKDTSPEHEYLECAFLYSTKESTFKNYLRWYDLHVNEKISIRLIAHIESNPGKAIETLQRLNHGKIKWGLTIAGEDKIQKGVAKVFKAIHRKDYTKEDVMEEYNCPSHGSNCPQKCSYLKEWEGKFNRLFPSNI
ncbi:MAG: hypothetical protein U0411_06570 [Thermodesulfovibrionales bacterium]